MTTQPQTNDLTGSDDELRHILDRDEVLVCTRVWEAWGYGTMSADDFEPYTAGLDDPESGASEILAWRDAAVETFRKALVSALLGAESQAMGLPPDSGDWLSAMADFVFDFTPR